jgi:D-glycero-D-manno-heptose 1,7-bisphosphate phosphatase
VISGVINEMNFNAERKVSVPPYRKEELKIFDGVIESLKKFQENDFKLFLISNQPDYAMGFTSLESLAEVHNELDRILKANDISFTEYYYCYHHKDGIIPVYSIDCDCRKPKNYFVLKAITEFEIDKEKSWFIGDRDKDVLCGISSGLKTIRIDSGYYEYKNNVDADFVVKDLKEAAKIIL